MKTSETTSKIFKAMAEFRKDLKQPVKDAKNPFFKSTYVTLDGVVKAIDDAIVGKGLSYSQEATTEGNYISVATHVFHESGEYISFEPLTLPATKADAQGFGSAVTYAKRYAIGAVFGVTSDIDDDGNQTSGKNAPKNADKTHIEVAKAKISELSKQHNIDYETARKTVWKHVGLKGQLDRLSSEEMGQLLNYLNKK